MRFYNSLNKKIEAFEPIEKGQVKMYHCGPTVYDRVHIGNLRSFMLADLLHRLFLYEGYDVRQIINITDIGQLSDNDAGEDKMTKGLKREGMPITLEAMRKLADIYTEKFQEDISKLNILSPDKFPKASEHLPEQIDLIKDLENKGFTYNTSDGVYFDTSKDADYGRLGGIEQDGEEESRIGENKEKKNPKDFALWKLNDKIGFESPWGQGFPGWHIECSAMSVKYLGQPFDIHTGGIDLAPIHHNNEIAQSESSCGCPLSNYWLHNEFLNIKDSKMAKSEGNFITLDTIEEKGYSPLSYRYFLLGSHYRTPTNFSWEALEASENAYKRLKIFMMFLDKQIEQSEENARGEISESYVREFKEALENDLNTSEALAVVWKLAKNAGDDISYADTKETLLDFDRVLGLSLENNEFKVEEIPDEIKSLLNERQKAREDEDWARSDELRAEIESRGYIIKDSKDGQGIERA
jgi:cysteinyl-tRNA synthetase